LRNKLHGREDKNTILDGTFEGVRPYIDNACEVIRKALAEAGLQARVDPPSPAIRQISKDLWRTDIDVRLVLNISARVEPLGPVDVDHI
jgi:hypothetical protein